MKISLLFLLCTFCLGIGKNKMPSEEVCKNRINTDSLYKAWNQSSVENMLSQGLERNYERIFQLYKREDNFRLDFCKVIINDSILTERKIQEGFFVVEKITSGSSTHYDNYLIVHDNKYFEVFYYRFSNREDAWLLMDEPFIISKKKFLNFYKKTKRQKAKDDLYPFDLFNVTEFSNTKVESFVSLYNGCKDCVEVFEKIMGSGNKKE